MDSITNSVPLTDAESMSMVLLDINPQELETEGFPVDQRHVQEMLASLPLHNNRIVFPPYVWLRDKRIIDGFHRVVVAKQAGIATLTVAVVDVPETRFWDLRIMAAKPHHAVEDARLYAWMEECWAADWGGDGRSEIANQLWALFRGESFRQSGNLFTRLERARLPVAQQGLYDWFADKSARWGIPVESLADRILTLWQVKAPLPEVDEIAASAHFTLPQRNELATQAKRAGVSGSVLKEWNNAGRPQSLPEFARAYSRRKVEQQQIKALQQQQRAQTPVAQEQQQLRRFTTLRDALTRSGDAVVAVEHLFPLVPEAPVLVAGLQERIRAISKTTVLTDNEALLAENARLRKENAHLQIRVASLERALDSQTKTTVPASVLAWSSVDLPNIA